MASGNFCTLSPIHAQGGGTPNFGALSNGNTTAELEDTAFGTFGVTSGKWYWEFVVTSSSPSGQCVGWANEHVNSTPELGYNSPSSPSTAQIVYMYLDSSPPEIISDAPKSESSGTDVDYGSVIGQNDIVGLAGDFDNDKWYFSINGSFTNMRSGQNPSTGANPLCSASGGGGLVTIARTTRLTWFPAIGSWASSTRTMKVNFGQDSTFSASFSAGGNSDENGFGDFKYPVPTGFKAMCSGNLPISDDIDPAQTDTDFPQKQFNTILYTGIGGTSANNVTGVGFQPDLIWIKNREQNASFTNTLVDSSRGRSKVLYSQRTDAEATSSTNRDISSINSDGFTIQDTSNIDGNQSGIGYVAWCWRAGGGVTSSNTDGDITSTVQANTKAGFSIVTYTGNRTSSGVSTVGHGLSSAPDMVITKSRSNSGNWWVQHIGTSTASKILNLQSYNAETDKSGNGTLSRPTATVFGTNYTDGLGTNGQTHIAYCWHSVVGYSSFGKFEGNGDDENGTFIYLGFRPRLIFCKNIDTANEWFVQDTARSTHNPTKNFLEWDTSDAEQSNAHSEMDILSNGFKCRGNSGRFNDTATYIYGAWGDVPFKYNNTF